MNGQRHSDDCPNCGTRVEADGARSIGAGHPSERGGVSSFEQSADCPKCACLLRRQVGSAWLVSPREWVVVVRGTPHDLILTKLGNAGALQRSSSVVADPSGPGLDRGRYEARVTEDTADAARATIEKILAGCDFEIVGVTPA